MQSQEDTSSGSMKKAARMSFPDGRKGMKGDQIDEKSLLGSKQSNRLQ